MLGIIIVLIVITFGVGFGTYKMATNNMKENQRKQEEFKEEIKSSWEILNKEYSPKSKKYMEKNYFETKTGDLYFYEDNKLFCLTKLFNLDFYTNALTDRLPKQLEEIIDFKDVKYYNITGSEREEQIISGGGGGGSSIKGAVVGGLVAGEVGAIIGSRKKAEGITTSYKKIDDRKLKITFKNGTIKNIRNFELYEYLLENVPEKDYDNYIYNLKSKGKE